jgi:ABC-type sulfate/molybdate transport systems ATPase subunit
MVKEPAVMLLDEPLSNLDAKLRASARDELERFQRQLGMTTIFVTHDQIEAMGLGDRIVVMNAGKVRQIGTPQEIYHDPADIFRGDLPRLADDQSHRAQQPPDRFSAGAFLAESDGYRLGGSGHPAVYHYLGRKSGG